MFLRCTTRKKNVKEAPVWESGRKPPRRWWPARLGARINSSCRSGEVQRDADDRCSSSHHRRPDHHPFAIHPARGRFSAPAQTTQTRITRSATAQNHGLRPTGQIALRSEDFLGTCVDFERLTIDVPLESAKFG